MVIRNKDNFKSIIVKMLIALGYENVQPQDSGVIDITATKEGERYCFKCSYDIDAIGEKKIAELADATKGGNYTHAVYVTNSSFISSAKKKGEACGIELWDRNTVDRLTIGIADEQLEDLPEEKTSPLRIVIPVVAVVVVVAIAAAVYFFLLRK